MPKKYDARVIHSYKSFKIADICRLYKEQKIHPQTIRKLIKEGKLEAFEYQGEWYVYGAILKQHFENKNKGRKKTLEFHQFSCRKCKNIDSPLNNTITKPHNWQRWLRDCFWHLQSLWTRNATPL